MRLAIFGATGNAGSELLNQALDAGHELTALARNPAKVPRRDGILTVVKDDVRDYASVEQTVAGCGAVLSTLGAADKNDADVRRAGTENIATAMREARVRRFVVLGGFHIEFPGDPDNLGRRLLVRILRRTENLIEDSAGMCAVIRSCQLDWTLVRIPRITRGQASGRAQIGVLRLGPWSKVSRATIASFMLDCAINGNYVRQAPMICDR